MDADEEERTDEQKRSARPRKTENHRWTDEQTNALLNLVSNELNGVYSRFEKPICRRFYEKIRTFSPLLQPLSHKVMRNKMHNCKVQYKRALYLLHNPETGHYRGYDGSTMQARIQRACPKFHMLHNIFGLEGAMQQAENEVKAEEQGNSDEVADATLNIQQYAGDPEYPYIEDLLDDEIVFEPENEDLASEQPQPASPTTSNDTGEDDGDALELPIALFDHIKPEASESNELPQQPPLPTAKAHFTLPDNGALPPPSSLVLERIELKLKLEQEMFAWQQQFTERELNSQREFAKSELEFDRWQAEQTYELRRLAIERDLKRLKADTELQMKRIESQERIRKRELELRYSDSLVYLKNRK